MAGVSKRVYIGCTPSIKSVRLWVLNILNAIIVGCFIIDHLSFIEGSQ